MKMVLKARRVLIAISLLQLPMSMVWAQKPKVSDPNAVNDPTATKATMNLLYQNLIKIIPLTQNDTDFRSPANREVIESSLKSLSDNAQKIGTHAAPVSKDNIYAGRSLSEDVKNIQRKFERGRYEEARYLLTHITEACITCHSKLPSDNSYHADSFFKNIPMEKLSLAKKASLLTALRDFGGAKEAYEKLFSDLNTPPSELILQGSITDYLILSLRVQYDPKRALTHLTKLSQRADVPSFLKMDLDAWNKSLKELPTKAPTSNLKNLAINRIETAQKSIHFPMDRKAFVDYVYASSLLHRFVDSAKKSDPNLGEAFYWLGVTESVIGRSFWLSETEYYLETAIRMSPHSKFAEKSYALLEEHALLEYSGSSGTFIPDDIHQKLTELKGLSGPKKATKK